MRTRTYAAFAAFLMLIGGAALVADQGGRGDHNNEARLRTRLAGAAIQGKTPEGNADFRSDQRGRSRLNVEVEQVNMPDNTLLEVSLTHSGMESQVAEIKLTAGFGEMGLSSQDGDVAPAVAKGDTATVKAGKSAILAGVFQAHQVSRSARGPSRLPCRWGL